MQDGNGLGDQYAPAGIRTETMPGTPHEVGRRMRMQIHDPVSRALSPATGIYADIAFYRRMAAGKRAVLDMRQGTPLKRAAQSYRQDIMEGVGWGARDRIDNEGVEAAVQRCMQDYAQLSDEDLGSSMRASYRQIDLCYRALERTW